MTLDLSILTASFGNQLIGSIGIFLRIAAVMAVLPVFGERGVPLRIRLVLTICFTVIVGPVVVPKLQPFVDGSSVPIRLFLTETIAGLTLGIGIRMFVFALQTAGEIAAQSASLAQIFGGSSVVDAQPAFANLMLFAGLALATLSGLHIKISIVLVNSYSFFPPGQFLPAIDLANWGVKQIFRAFELAFSLAAPFVLASLIYNLALGIINRAMPQLMVAFVGAPAISGGGLVILFLSLPALLEVWSLALDTFLSDPLTAPK